MKNNSFTIMRFLELSNLFLIYHNIIAIFSLFLFLFIFIIFLFNFFITSFLIIPSALKIPGRLWTVKLWTLNHYNINNNNNNKIKIWMIILTITKITIITIKSSTTQYQDNANSWKFYGIFTISQQ